MADLMTSLIPLARKVADELQRSDSQLVLAESCTAGLVAAALGAVPGISRHLCGSAVVYQEGTKTAWLGVSETLLEAAGAVSAETAVAMVEGALAGTPHADVAVAVTGHLGPEAPVELDGVLYIAAIRRGMPPSVKQHRLSPPATSSRDEARLVRQSLAAEFVLSACLAALQSA
jgi:PncC family amidohydrolase